MATEWYIALVQWEKLVTDPEGKTCMEGTAWDTVFMIATSREQALGVVSGMPCRVKGFRRGPKTTVIVHKIGTLDDVMEEKDVTVRPERKRLKRNKS